MDAMPHDIAKRPYKVLLIDLARSYGGAEVRTQTQATALESAVQGCAVAVLHGSPLHERLTKLGVPCEVLAFGRGSPALALKLRAIIKRGGYHIIDAHNVQSILWGHWAAWLAGVRGCVATIHSDYGAEYPNLKGKFYEGVLRLNRLIARQYITVTETLQSKAERQGLGERATLIHNAVPIPPLPLPEPDHALRAAWNAAPDDFVIGIVARLKPVKGHRYLLDAMAQVRDLPVKLVIIGEGPLHAELTAQVQALGIADRVHFAGFREDVLSLLPSLDCVCMASLSEALPYAVLEAASYARPLLCTAVGGLATLLQEGVTARLVPAQDSAALAEGIRQLTADRQSARQLGMNAYQMVAERFSQTVMLKKILQVYDKAIGI
ncbi:MAG: glycosyltransferase family 1 protein [Chloroflexi bacterium CFX4]|nr:glycosyltransferase family 1 protein [Chloroflexi bacterium CFX4]MDL1923834.1 glycosyltransferase family 4 protein [Chloroflexi bacterium CFX3]